MSQHKLKNVSIWNSEESANQCVPGQLGHLIVDVDDLYRRKNKSRKYKLMFLLSWMTQDRLKTGIGRMEIWTIIWVSVHNLRLPVWLALSHARILWLLNETSKQF